MSDEEGEEESSTSEIEKNVTKNIKSKKSLDPEVIARTLRPILNRVAEGNL